jgi:hypothetical protein
VASKPLTTVEIATTKSRGRRQADATCQAYGEMAATTANEQAEGLTLDQVVALDEKSMETAPELDVVTPKQEASLINHVEVYYLQAQDGDAVETVRRNAITDCIRQIAATKRN